MPPGAFSFNGSRTVLSVTEERLFGVGLMGDFYCLDRESGELLWKKHLVKDFGGKDPLWGVPQTPFVHKGAVLVAAYGKSALLAKYDQQSGELIWSSCAGFCRDMGLPGSFRL